MAQYDITVTTIEINKLIKKGMPCFRKIGNEMNKAKEGITSQNTPVDSALTFEIFLVSMYSHTIDNTETNGMEAKIAPKKELRLAISEIAKIKKVVTRILTR